MEKLEELVSLQNQVKVVRLQDKLGKQSFLEDMKKVIEPVTKSLEDTSQDIPKTITETSINNKKSLQNLNNKLLEIRNDRGIIATYLMSPLSKITNPENSSQFNLVQDSCSNRVNDLLIHNTFTSTLHDILLTYRDTGKVFELEIDLLKMITNKNYNADLASLADKKLIFDFAKEMHFDSKAQVNKSTRDRTLIKLLKSPSLMVSDSGVPKTIFCSPDPNEVCDRLTLLLQEKHAANIANIINEEIIAIFDNLLEYRCISKN